MLHQVRGLLMSLDAVWQSQEDVLGCRRGKAELAVRVLADLEPFVIGSPGQPVEAPDRPHPVRGEAEDVRLSRANAGVRVRFRPEPLVRADHRVGPGAQLGKLSDGVIANGLLDEVDVVLAECPEVAERLRNRPAAVRVEPEPRRRAE